jgi:outer membrane protein assembly factor BamB
LWSVPAESPSYPLIAQDLVIVTERHGDAYGTLLVALDAHTGAESWSHPLSGTYFWSNATYDRGRVFVVNADGLVTAIDASDGAQVWAAKMPNEYSFSSPPTAAGGVVYVLGAGIDGILYAVDESDGSLLWMAKTLGGDHSSPAVNGDTVAIAFSCITYGFSLAGQERWNSSSNCIGGIGATAAIWNDLLYSRANGGVAMSMADGSTKGAFSSVSIPAFADDLMYTVNDGRLDAVQVGTGVGRWHVEPSDPIVTAPLVMGSWVIAAGSAGTVYAFDVATGATQWSDVIPSTIEAPDERNGSQPLTGLGAAGPLLVIPTSDRVVAYQAKGPWNLDGIPPAGAAAAPTGSAAGSDMVGYGWGALALALMLGAAIGGVGATVVRARSGHRGRPRTTIEATADPPPARPDMAERR